VCPQLADDPSTAPSQNERRTHSAAIHRRATDTAQTAATKRDRPIAIIAQQAGAAGP